MISAQNLKVSAIVTNSPIQDCTHLSVITPVRPGRCFSASFFDTRLATRRRGVFFFFFYRDCRSIFNLIAVIAFFTVESIMDLTDQNIIGSFYKPGKIYIT